MEISAIKAYGTIGQKNIIVKSEKVTEQRYLRFAGSAPFPGAQLSVIHSSGQIFTGPHHLRSDDYLAL